MHSEVWEAIDEQLLPRDIDEEVKQQYLLILDGLDELPSIKLSIFFPN